MKNITNTLKNLSGKHTWVLFLLVFLAALPACQKDFRQLDKGDSPLAVSADKASLVLLQQNDNTDAVTFSWTSGTNKGTNAAIGYQLKIDRQGNNFSHAWVQDIGAGNLSKKYTVQELNALVLSQWTPPPGTEITLEAKVVATVADNLAPADSSAIITIKVTPYLPVSSTLYLIGDATPKGWDAGQATKLTAGTTPGSFIWEGNLSGGEFKLITTLGQFLPSYNKGASSNHIVYRTQDAAPDDKFVITTPGLYNITVNLLDLTIDIAASTLPAYSRLWMLGDAVPTGWNIDNPAEMRVDSSNLFVFTYNEILKAGEFKIPVATGNFGTDYYMPATNHPDLASTSVQLVAGGSPDNKWQITNPGPYKIKLDIQNNTIDIKPFVPYTSIWMVGDATPAGWNIDAPQALMATAGNPYEFTYTGLMNVGEFKFPLATGNWGCDYFMPAINGYGAGSTQMKFIKSGSPDNKWKITQAGNYKITINQLYETISIVKQ